MSVTGNLGEEVRRAAARGILPTGGVTDDVARLQADEDRELVGLLLGSTAGMPALEASFSSTSSAVLSAGAGDVEARASLLAIKESSGGLFQTLLMNLDLNIAWSEGEEIHLHSRNNTAAQEEGMMICYYIELE